jgi:hypothetical protein
MTKKKLLVFLVFLFFSTSVYALYYFDEQCFVKTLSGSWDDKGGTASSYYVSGSNYRCYKPSVSRRSDGGLLISFKMDHIRRFKKDDHAIISMILSKNGSLISANAKVIIQGESDFTVWAPDPDVVIITYISTQIYNKIIAMTDDGGRIYFAEDIKHNMNHAYNCVRN